MALISNEEMSQILSWWGKLVHQQIVHEGQGAEEGSHEGQRHGDPSRTKGLYLRAPVDNDPGTPSSGIAEAAIRAR